MLHEDNSIFPKQQMVKSEHSPIESVIHRPLVMKRGCRGLAGGIREPAGLGIRMRPILKNESSPSGRAQSNHTLCTKPFYFFL